jgi:hypothetical protein
MLALKVVRQIEQRLHAAFGTTGDDPYAVTLPDALASVSQLWLLRCPATKSGEVVTKLPRPNDTQKKILHALNVSLPKVSADTPNPAGRNNCLLINDLQSYLRSL